MLVVDRRAIRRSSHVDSEGTWAISYGDMVTLLLAFFVLFFTMDSETQRQSQMQQSLVMALSDGEHKPLQELSYQAKLNIGTEPGNNIDQKIIEEWGGDVHQLGEQIIVDFPGVSFFKLGQIGLTIEGKKILKLFSQKYMPYAGKYKLGVRAFTDSRPVKAVSLIYRDNLELSALRSIAAMRALRNYGIPLEQMKLGGYGELKGTYDGLKKIAEEKGLNDKLALARRIVLVIEPELKGEKL